MNEGKINESNLLIYKIEDNLKNLINEKDIIINEMNIKLKNQENEINKNKNDIQYLKKIIMEITTDFKNKILDKDIKINEMNKKILNQENEIKKFNEKISNANKNIIEKQNMMNEYNKKENKILLKEFKEKNDEINAKIKNLQERFNYEIENKIIKYINENNSKNTSQKNNYYQDLLKNSINLKCRCPCKYCRSSGQIIQWKCPKCSSDEYINEQARIVCPICGLKEYIWKKKFKCGNQDEDYHEISYQGWLVNLSALGSISNLPFGFIKKLTKQCLLHEEEFLEE